MRTAHHTPRDSETRHNTRQHDTPHRSAPPCNTPQQGYQRHDRAQHHKTRRGTARRSQPRHGKTHHGTTRRGTAQQGRAQRNTAQTSTAQHGKARHKIARRTKEHHSTKARDTNRGSNPSKLPHAPEGNKTRPQPQDNATQARRTQARGHCTPRSNSDGLSAQAATRKLQLAPQRRGDTENPTPFTPRPHETAWRNRPAGRART